MKNYKTNQDDYYVFVMYKQLNFRGLLKSENEDGLDRVWERCKKEYINFLHSRHNDLSESTFDCIVGYVRDLVEDMPRKKYDIIVQRTYETYVEVEASSKEEANRIGYNMTLDRESDQNHVVEEVMYIDNKKVKIHY